MKKIKTAYIGIFLIFLMFGSTFAYAVIQSVNTPSQQNSKQTFPTGIIDYELSDSQLYELLRSGYTLMSYRYNITCVKCAQDRSILEQITSASEFDNQIVLQEILSENAGDLTITSAYGEEKFSIFTANNVVESLCRLTVNPPTECAVLQFQKSGNSSANTTE